jgi:hypothetical protein
MKNCRTLAKKENVSKKKQNINKNQMENFKLKNTITEIKKISG